MLTAELPRSTSNGLRRRWTAWKERRASLKQRLQAHFGRDPAGLPVVSESFDKCEQPNLHIAVESFIETAGHATTLVGLVSEPHSYGGTSLARLASKKSLFSRMMSVQAGPVEYSNLHLDDGKVLACVQSGLYLIQYNRMPIALLVDRAGDMGPFSSQIKAEVMAVQRESSEAILATLRQTMRKNNVYRGRVISLEVDRMHNTKIIFHCLPDIGPDGIILPPGLLDRIQRQTIRFSAHGERLKAAGRHLKRGLLLHGPPGTGKTLTAMYLAASMKDRTVLLVTGRGQGLIEQVCAMARTLQPATVIVEDVDLIAEDRNRDGCALPILFELLNQMDGLAEDADVLFLLTTNQPDRLEPALAARPGRVDQAIEIPLPDATCRQRLMDLYSQGMTVRLSDPDRWVARTAGGSAAFIRELLRKAALFAADESPGDGIIVEDRHVEDALRELVFEGGALTQRLLGFKGQTGNG